MARFLVFSLALLSLSCHVIPQTTPTAPEPRPEGESDEPPEGYYAFVESPNATPPRVRPPPYRQSSADCPDASDARPHVTAHNLCGDLNRGLIPRNPMGQSHGGEPYPFELIRNQSLRFLSRTLPVLRADDTLPRVAHVPTHPDNEPYPTHGSSYPTHGSSYPAHGFNNPAHGPARDVLDEGIGNGIEERVKRSLSEPDHAAVDSSAASHTLPVEHRADSGRESRKFCDGGGVFCMLYRAINGESAPPPLPPAAGVERREDPGTHAHNHPAALPRYEGPPTPCPARVEYATPVFARNYQGVWRYVVQIPYEGYFTQTVEVTRCMSARCHYLEGGCLSSPRWVSLLVAELHYPPNQTDSSPGTTPAPHCDGHDEMGCYQVRLYYDWFLVPGSCKCWRPDYFARYVRRRNTNNEL